MTEQTIENTDDDPGNVGPPRSRLLELVDRACSYRASGKMVAFWFVLLTLAGIAVIACFTRRWVRISSFYVSVALNTFPLLICTVY